MEGRGERGELRGSFLPSPLLSPSTLPTDLISKLWPLILLELLPVLIEVVLEEIEELCVRSGRDGRGSKHESSSRLKSESSLQEQ